MSLLTDLAINDLPQVPHVAEKLIADKHAVNPSPWQWFCGVARSPYHVTERSKFPSLFSSRIVYIPHKYDDIEFCFFHSMQVLFDSNV